MIPDIILFIILAAIAIASALGMLLSRGAIYSALNLIINFGTVALFYFILQAPFIALAQVTVYAGAIMVLFLFVIMLLGAEQLRGARRLGWQEWLAIGAGTLLVLEAVYIVLIRPGTAPPFPTVPAAFGDPAAVGVFLFNEYLLPFEITSVLLLVAMVGAIVLSKRRRPAQSSRQP